MWTVWLRILASSLKWARRWRRVALFCLVLCSQIKWRHFTINQVNASSPWTSRFRMDWWMVLGKILKTVCSNHWPASWDCEHLKKMWKWSADGSPRQLNLHFGEELRRKFESLSSHGNKRWISLKAKLELSLQRQGSRTFLQTKSQDTQGQAISVLLVNGEDSSSRSKR